ncbi:heterokaryon incompatibility protein-domain-containing protein, partial [Bisporella sp. PMI_857]
MLRFDIEASASDSNPDESEQSWSSSLLFPIESNLGDVAHWLRLEKPPMTQVLCKENIAMMTYNINRCVQSCHPLRKTSFMPTRLLDVGYGSSLECPRLVITQDLIPPIGNQTEVVKYAALSYCWGSTVEGNSQLKTEKSSLEARLAGIPIEIMSQPVKDAVRIARALSLRYIWVDALCIVQDDHDDWDKESVNMGLIYGHAYVTFCLLGSSFGQEGYLDRTISKIDIGFKSSIAPPVCGVYTINDPILFPNYTSTTIDLISLDEHNSSWPTRGWTFQEYHLSTRLLFFGRSRIHFLCENNQTSENAADDRHYDSLFSDIVMSQESGNDTTMRMYEWWREVLPLYAGRNLTIPKDKLPAISGLAKYVAVASNDSYLAGLWKGDLLRELLWTPTSTALRGLKTHLQALDSPNPYIAPSWSWACQNS